MKHRKKGGGGGQNFWPGYVDALTNVVLNLLFMVAIFGIALAVFTSIPHEGAGDGGKKGLAGSTDGRAHVALAGPPGPGTAFGVRASAGPGGSLASSPLAASPSPTASITAQSGPAGGAPAASGNDLHFSVVDAYRRSGGPDSEVHMRPQSGGGMLVSVSIPAGGQPTVELAKQRVGLALKAALPAKAGHYTIWTSAPRADAGAKRIAYFAVNAARNQLLGLGIPETTIETRIYDGSASAADGMHIYVLAKP